MAAPTRPSSSRPGAGRSGAGSPGVAIRLSPVANPMWPQAIGSAPPGQSNDPRPNGLSSRRHASKEPAMPKRNETPAPALRHKPARAPARARDVVEEVRRCAEDARAQIEKSYRILDEARVALRHAGPHLS